MDFKKLASEAGTLFNRAKQVRKAFYLKYINAVLLSHAISVVL